MDKADKIKIENLCERIEAVANELEDIQEKLMKLTERMASLEAEGRAYKWIIGIIVPFLTFVIGKFF
ncbi:MAG: hypothetical protein GX452_13800 [Ignavibacteriales bacterium]|nr:hypothetical protein [Ignavibacteriales bacterium]